MSCKPSHLISKIPVAWSTSSHRPLPFLATTDKQELLETPDVMLRMERINKHLAKEAEVQQLRNKIQTEVQDQVQQSQRDYYLREQLKAIQKEIGELDEGQKRH